MFFKLMCTNTEILFLYVLIQRLDNFFVLNWARAKCLCVVGLQARILRSRWGKAEPSGKGAAFNVESRSWSQWLSLRKTLSFFGRHSTPGTRLLSQCWRYVLDTRSLSLIMYYDTSRPVTVTVTVSKDSLARPVLLKAQDSEHGTLVLIYKDQTRITQVSGACSCAVTWILY